MKTVNQFIQSVIVVLFFVGITSCEQQDRMLELESESAMFDFNQFGKSHNAYLEYVTQIKDKNNSEARFNYGKTFNDPVFGSFNVGITWGDLENTKALHLRRVELILNGTYNSDLEKVNPSMIIFLDNLASTVKQAVDNKYSLKEFTREIEYIETNIIETQEIQIDLIKGVSNDGASMLAICAILKYSIEYWSLAINSDDGDNLPLARGRIKRALADAWGYVSAWVNNGDGSYSWDHESALVNSACVSDSVR